MGLGFHEACAQQLLVRSNHSATSYRNPSFSLPPKGVRAVTLTPKGGIKGLLKLRRYPLLTLTLKGIKGLR